MEKGHRSSYVLRRKQRDRLPFYAANAPHCVSGRAVPAARNASERLHPGIHAPLYRPFYDANASPTREWPGSKLLTLS